MDWIYKHIEKGKRLTTTAVMKKEGVRTVVGLSFNGQNALAGPMYATAVFLTSIVRINNFTLKRNLKKEECDEMSESFKFNPKVMWDLGVVPSYNFLHFDLKDTLGTAALSALTKLAFLGNIDIVISEPFGWERVPDIYKGTRIICHKNAADFFDAAIIAGIIAKASREQFMKNLGYKYPEYGWETNAGYAVHQHLNAIYQYGITAEHRNLEQTNTFKGKEFKVYQRVRS